MNSMRNIVETEETDGMTRDVVRGVRIALHRCKYDSIMEWYCMIVMSRMIEKLVKSIYYSVNRKYNKKKADQKIVHLSYLVPFPS